LRTKQQRRQEPQDESSLVAKIAHVDNILGKKYRNTIDPIRFFDPSGLIDEYHVTMKYRNAISTVAGGKRKLSEWSYSAICCHFDIRHSVVISTGGRDLITRN
jgi:hypothetical protein